MESTRRPPHEQTTQARTPAQYTEGDVEKCDISAVPLDILDAIEADSYWCMTKLLDGIQDNYTSAQPGIQRKVLNLEELMVRLDRMCLMVACARVFPVLIVCDLFCVGVCLRARVFSALHFLCVCELCAVYSPHTSDISRCRHRISTVNCALKCSFCKRSR